MFEQETIRIVRLGRGHVRVARCSREGEYLVMQGGAIVRKWGTTEGLGELAEHGPRDAGGRKTILDRYHRASRVHVLAVVEEIECNEDAWRAYFDASEAPKPKRKSTEARA
jgi:hypothetical protein